MAERLMQNQWPNEMTSNPFFEIRRGDVNDLPSVMIIMGEAFNPKYGEAWSAGQCESMLSLPGSWLLIASVKDQPAAFSLIRSFAGEAELLLIATHPSFQRLDIGKALINHMLVECADAQINVVHLEVRADNPALSFYKMAGFGQVGVRPNYYRGALGRQTDAITLSMQIG
jgi:[ribosomal protein S18]-alanine N-acetyltransferase